MSKPLFRKRDPVPWGMSGEEQSRGECRPGLGEGFQGGRPWTNEAIPPAFVPEEGAARAFSGDGAERRRVKPYAPSMNRPGCVIVRAFASALPVPRDSDSLDIGRDGRESKRELVLESLLSDLFEARLAPTFD